MESGDHNRGWIADLVSRVLAYMDRPWKAVVVIGLVIVVGGGYALWIERDKILRSFESRTRDSVALVDDLRPLVDEVVENTTVDLAMVWSINLSTNEANFKIGKIRGDGDWNFSPRRLPIITGSTEPNLLVRVLNGGSACHDPNNDPNSLFRRRLVSSDMHWMCVVPIPPSQYQSLIGILDIAWKTKPDQATQDATLTTVADIAGKMVH